MSATLVILAAGASSRFGKESKQEISFGPNQETIMDYSIYDALKAGFTNVVVILKKENSKKFQNSITEKWAEKINLTFCYQTISDEIKPEHLSRYLNIRTKPWGTGHALFCLLEHILEPFAIINADDLYGRKSFSMAYKFLKKEIGETFYANLYYTLKDTMSAHGEVTRGVCISNKNNYLNHLTEYKKLKKTQKGIWSSAEQEYLDPEEKVSMNFWCFHPYCIQLLKNEFLDFLATMNNKEKDEFILPEVMGLLIQKQFCSVKMIPSSSKWFGVTFSEDAPLMKKYIAEQIEKKTYPKTLF